MPKGGKAKSLISAAIFILLEVAAVYLMSNSSILKDVWLNRASHRVSSFLWGHAESVRNWFSLDRQNADLLRENARLSALVRQYANVSDSIPADTHHGFEFIPARVVKMGRNTGHGYVVLDKGSADGIVPQSGIISANGVIGIVDAVSEHYCYGLTLMNSSTSVSARVGDVSGAMVWDGLHRDRALLKELSLHQNIQPGDTVFTSGYSAIFPSDIALGIAGESRIVDGTTKQVDVKLFQDFGAVRHVAIVRNRGGKEISSLENRKKR